ncbi:MAG: NfeD family protein [Lachnospiraceae bacterium]|nr:NfeD family protein [Lachnospiraceae bacterium]
MNPVIMWLAVLVILVIVELATMGLTTIWFAGGALIATVIAALEGPLWLQFVCFVVVSLVLLVLTRPVAMRYFNQNREKTNADSLVGKQAIVTLDINNLLGAGQVMLNGMEWSARSAKDDVKIEAGAVVVVKSISGVKVLVEPQEMEK